MIRLLMFDPIAQLLLSSNYIADSGGKYPSRIGLHRGGNGEEWLLFFKPQHTNGLEGRGVEEQSKHSFPLSICQNWHQGLGNPLGASVPGLG